MAVVKINHKYYTIGVGGGESQLATQNRCTEYHYYIAKIASWDGQIRCDNCPCMQTYSRKQCELTGEYIADSRRIGYLCPLIPVSIDQWYELENLRNMEDENANKDEYAII